MNQKGFINIITVIIILVLVGAGVYFILTKEIMPSVKTNQKNTMQNSSAPNIKLFYLGEKFTLKSGESAIEKENYVYVPEPGEATLQRDYLEITNQGVVKRLLKPPGGEQRVVTLLLKKGSISETITLKESLTPVEGMTILALTSWQGYLITLKDADAFGATATLEVSRAMEQ